MKLIGYVLHTNANIDADFRLLIHNRIVNCNLSRRGKQSLTRPITSYACVQVEIDGDKRSLRNATVAHVTDVQPYLGTVVVIVGPSDMINLATRKITSNDATILACESSVKSDYLFKMFGTTFSCTYIEPSTCKSRYIDMGHIRENCKNINRRLAADEQQRIDDVKRAKAMLRTHIKHMNTAHVNMHGVIDNRLQDARHRIRNLATRMNIATTTRAHATPDNNRASSDAQALDTDVQMTIINSPLFRQQFTHATESAMATIKLRFGMQLLNIKILHDRILQYDSAAMAKRGFFLCSNSAGQVLCDVKTLHNTEKVVFSAGTESFQLKNRPTASTSSLESLGNVSESAFWMGGK